ncbi:hypothetical protein [Lentzea sp. NBRC 105346]|nr:hypothetical protein [Lentzea sp. NBRC 105346]
MTNRVSSSMLTPMAVPASATIIGFQFFCPGGLTCVVSGVIFGSVALAR